MALGARRMEERLVHNSPSIYYCFLLATRHSADGTTKAGEVEKYRVYQARNRPHHNPPFTTLYTIHIATISNVSDLLNAFPTPCNPFPTSQLAAKHLQAFLEKEPHLSP
jgi:hypothetical protein